MGIRSGPQRVDQRGSDALKRAGRVGYSLGMNEGNRDRHTELQHPRRMRAAFARVRELLGARLSAMERQSPLEAAFGPLEVRVLETLWRREGPCRVADLRGDFPGAAYTTLMTTMDRLFKKAVLQRDKRGRAYAYTPRYTRAELNARLMREAFDVLLMDGGRGGPNPLLSTFVEAVSEHDAALLGELERLVQEKRGDLDTSEPATASRSASAGDDAL